jgi:hypothetical protein
LPNTVIINDRIGLNHASLNGGATKVPSSAPVGGGVSDRLTIAADGTVIFPNTQTTMILAPGTAWTGEVVVSRLHVDPNVSPNSNSNMNQYWIVNNYGSTPALPLQSLTFTTTFITPTGAASSVQLSNRSDNAHLNNWNNLCTAANITGNSILFNNTCNISNFGQFVASSPNFTQVSIDEVLENNIVIYPNPSTGIFHIALPSNQTYQIEVVDNMGRVVLNQSNIENTSMLDLSDQASGVYLIRLIDTAGNVSFGRVVKR